MRLIEVNIQNTLSTVALARNTGAKKYFCVSTDKAANPVNMMGASKRIMEMFLVREVFPCLYRQQGLQMSPFPTGHCYMALTNALPSDSLFLRQMMLGVTL